VAYLAGALAGPLGVIAGAFLLSPHDGAVGEPFSTASFRAGSAETVFVVTSAAIVCLAIELLVVTPLLVGFARYRWRWLNGWTGAALGFSAGALLGLPVAQGFPLQVGLATVAASAIGGTTSALAIRFVGVRTSAAKALD
jgi:hypothetical protein